jgi:hypothetical protein
MSIPNVKRFRPLLPDLQRVSPSWPCCRERLNVDQYLPTPGRHDHKAFQEAKQAHFKIRVGQQKQKKAK